MNNLYLENLFNKGVRSFFGVLLDDKGRMIMDKQEPYDGFFKEFRYEN